MFATDLETETDNLKTHWSREYGYIVRVPTLPTPPLFLARSRLVQGVWSPGKGTHRPPARSGLVFGRCRGVGRVT